jgi:hypothetical protein
MMTFTTLLIASGLGGAVLPVADFDIPYFQANPQVREETIRRCRDDYRLAQTPECMNAEAAATRSLGRPLLGQELNELLKPRKPRPPQTPSSGNGSKERAA